MASVLHITNGDCAAGIMRHAGIVGEILPWRDLLHEGPVPAGLSLGAMSEGRARFIAECGWATPEDALAQFQARDSRLSDFHTYDEVVLWPFLAGAVVRHLEEFPSVENGLNRTERQLLEAVRSGARNPGRIFEAAQRAEERIFMGDSSFWLHMKSMIDARPPLLKIADGAQFRLPAGDSQTSEFQRQEILLAEAGEKILRGELDWIEVNGIDKWLGGVHLTSGPLWRWDRIKQQLVKGQGV